MRSDGMSVPNHSSLTSKDQPPQFFGGENAPLANVAKLLERGIPLLPVASDVSRVNVEIPAMMQPLNCLAYAAGGAQRVATALLECAGLLPGNGGFCELPPR